MGVQSLWTLLEPCGRRVNIEALTNKKLAVDASIWIFQFMQTMRDSRGEMLKNAHILGFFRRICRLLFHRVRPIFVFDGATPALKRRTTIARRRRREQQTAKLRKTAEKLLMAQLRKHALQLDPSLRDGGEQAEAAVALATSSEQVLDTIKEAEEEGELGPPDTVHDAILARQLAEELEGGVYAKEMMRHLEVGDAAGIEALTRKAANAVVTSPAGQAEQVKIEEGADDEDMDEDDEDADEEVIVPEGVNVDPAVLSTLPPSMQLDLMTKIRDNKIYENRARFQQHAAQPLNFSSFQIQEYLKASAFRRQIDGLKDTMNASVMAGVEGAVAKRIAGDENREYILQREEPDKVESPKAATPVSELKPLSNGDALEISFDLPGQKRKLDLDSIILNSPEHHKTSSSEEDEWLDVDTGEPASVSKAKKQQEAKDDEFSPDSKFKKPKDWKERKAQRQKYWSVSQGFRFGRKLEEWGEDPPARPTSGRTGSKDGDEDAEMQEAIRRSLTDAPGGQADSDADDNDNEGDQVWEGVPPPDEAGPSGSLPAANGKAAAHATILAASDPASPSAVSQLSVAKLPVANGSSESSMPAVLAATGSGVQKRASQQDSKQDSKRSDAGKRKDDTQRARKRIKLPSLMEEAAQKSDKSFQQHMDGIKESEAGQAEDRSQRKMIKLPSLSAVPAKSPESPAKQHIGRSNEVHDVHDVPLSDPAVQRKLSIGKGADASKRSQPREVRSELPHGGITHASPAAPAKPSPGPVAAALRQALTIAEEEASGDDDCIQEATDLEDVSIFVQDLTEQQDGSSGQANQSDHLSKGPGGSSSIAYPSKGPSDMGLTATGAREMHMRRADSSAADTQKGSESSALPSQPASMNSRAAAQHSVDTAPAVPAVKKEQQEKPSGSIAFTGPVQDVMQDMPGIPGNLSTGKPEASKEQQKQGSSRAAKSDADMAAEQAADAEEELRADLAQQEQQEQEDPPDEDVPCADPWAEDPWGQGNLWEDPGAGQPSAGPPPVSSAQPSSSSKGPRGGQPAQNQPVAAAFSMDDELLEIERETKKLKASHRKQVGTTETPTTDMYGDCQELLQLFGLPYIIAPAEAEAQCSWLDAQGLVDGVVTDDNDAFLFGAKHIYRHIFEGRKYVEEYHTSDVERELGMDRLGLICLALLLGSDYTEGVAGIGIVNAVEVVQAFKGEEGMKRFREWVMNPDEEELREAAQPKPKRGRKKGAEENAGDAAREDEDQSGNDRALNQFKRSHRQMRRNWDLPSKFPDIRVIDAYRKPSLDESKERFTYGRPDAQLIRNFCLEKFGWNFEKVDQILDPVLKAYDARQAQATMDSFLAFNERFAKIKSKRLQQAVRGISKAPNPELMMDDYGAEAPKLVRKMGKKAPSEAAATTPGSADPASQLGVFADRSESDEELLPALASGALSSEQRGRGKGQRGRGKRGSSGKKASAAGAAAQKSSERGRGRGRKGRGADSDPKAANKVLGGAAEAQAQNDKADDDIDWEPAC